MKLLIIAAAISALYLLEPRTIYLDGVKSPPMRYERADWRERSYRAPVQDLLIGHPPTSATQLVTWP